MPYISLGALLYAVFNPHVANVLLNVLLSLGNLYGIFRVIERHYQAEPALLFSLVVMVNPWLWQSATWDYPDGPALAFLSFGLWFFLAAPGWARGAVGVMLAGAMFAAPDTRT